MTTISLIDVQQDLPGCLRRVQQGEVLVITENDQPVAELKPVSPSPNGLRPFGLCAGEFQSPDDFDDPLPEEIQEGFEG